MPTSRKAELALLGVTLLWGTSFTVTKTALADVSPLLFVLLRFVLATAVLTIAWRGEVLPRSLPELRGGFYAGLCLFAGYFFQTRGLALTTPARSAFLTATFIVLVPLLSSFVYRNVPTIHEGMGVAIAFLGVTFFTSPGFSIDRRGIILAAGDWFTLACALGYAAHVLVIGRYAARVRHRLLAISQIGVVAALAGATFWWAEASYIRWTGRLGVALAVTSLLNTALPFAVQSWAQRHTTPTRAALIFSLEPVSASVTSYLVTGESLSRQSLTGAILILAGVLMVELRPLARPIAARGS